MPPVAGSYAKPVGPLRGVVPHERPAVACCRTVQVHQRVGRGVDGDDGRRRVRAEQNEPVVDHVRAVDVAQDDVHPLLRRHVNAADRLNVSVAARLELARKIDRARGRPPFGRKRGVEDPDEVACVPQDVGLGPRAHEDGLRVGVALRVPRVGQIVHRNVPRGVDHPRLLGVEPADHAVGLLEQPRRGSAGVSGAEGVGKRQPPVNGLRLQPEGHDLAARRAVVREQQPRRRRCTRLAVSAAIGRPGRVDEVTRIEGRRALEVDDVLDRTGVLGRQRGTAAVARQKATADSATNGHRHPEPRACHRDLEPHLPRRGLS